MRKPYSLRVLRSALAKERLHEEDLENGICNRALAGGGMATSMECLCLSSSMETALEVSAFLRMEAILACP